MNPPGNRHVGTRINFQVDVVKNGELKQRNGGHFDVLPHGGSDFEESIVLLRIGNNTEGRRVAAQSAVLGGQEPELRGGVVVDIHLAAPTLTIAKRVARKLGVVRHCRNKVGITADVADHQAVSTSFIVRSDAGKNLFSRRLGHGRRPEILVIALRQGCVRGNPGQRGAENEQGDDAKNQHHRERGAPAVAEG